MKKLLLAALATVLLAGCQTQTTAPESDAIMEAEDSMVPTEGMTEESLPPEDQVMTEEPIEDAESMEAPVEEAM